MRISDWSSDVCSSDLDCRRPPARRPPPAPGSGKRTADRSRSWPECVRDFAASVQRREVRAAEGASCPLCAWTVCRDGGVSRAARSEAHTSEIQSLMRISYAVLCLKKKTNKYTVNLYTTDDISNDT